MRRSPSNTAHLWRGNVIAFVILLQPSVVVVFFDFRTIVVIDLSLPNSPQNFSHSRRCLSIWQRCTECVWEGKSAFPGSSGSCRKH
ncbi:hypothetical protein ACSQ67_006747 [Phaseolus vulgaris]